MGDSEKFSCPRRSESPFGSKDAAECPDSWRDDRSCSYCGSMHPDDVLAAVKAGEKLGPTDKNYKVYVGNASKKAYFQHFAMEHRLEFIRLHNDLTMRVDYPGHFYVLPFFMRRVEPSLDS